MYIITVFILCIVMFGGQIQGHESYGDDIDAYIMLSDGSPPEFFMKPDVVIRCDDEPVSGYDALVMFLSNDSTSEHEYISSGEDAYVCVNFATDLAENLSLSGYDAGVVVKSAKWHNKGCGHMLTWANVDNELFVIESINDCIMLSNAFNESVDRDIYVVRYESIESGRRKVAEMYKRLM